MLNTIPFAGLFALATADEAPGFLKFGITGYRPSAGALVARQDEANLTQQLLGNSYTIELGIGTPPQNVVVQLDTGSTDLWVNPVCSAVASTTAEAFCKSLPQFNPLSSSTYKSLGTSGRLLYGSGSATIVWATDTIAIGTGSIKAQQFGVASTSVQETFGILGIAPTLGGRAPQYSFFIDTLVAQGVTASRAFSLDLRSIDSAEGSIIFGGIDTKKYTGALAKLPIVPAAQTAEKTTRYWLNLDSIDLDDGSGTNVSISSTAFNVLLDSGSTVNLLPPTVFENIMQNFPTARADSGGSGLYIVDCGVANQAGSVDFTFGQKTIKVAYKDFIWHVSSRTCVVGAEAGSASDISILGDSFLRAAYAVFDQDNQNIHLAQAADCGSNIVAITTGADAVPSLTGDCDAAVTVSSTTSSIPTSTTQSLSSTSSSSAVSSSAVSSPVVSSSPESSSPESTISEPTTVSTIQIPTTTATTTSTPGGGSATVSSPTSGASSATTKMAAAGVGKLVANAGAGLAVVAVAALL